MADTTLHEMSPDTALAIVGMAGRFPGAAGVDQFWQNVAGGIKSIRIFSEAELEAAGVEDALLRQPNYVKAGTVVADVELFDAAFFGYNPREAELMDPQHRLFLECAWEALERAACDPDTYGGRIGVFAGSGFSMYMLNNLYSNPELIQSVPALQIAVGNERDSLASTVSYKLNLKGPSIAVQTFCSTSLVATHLACQSLLTFESDVALAGGVAINIPQEKGYEYHEGDIVSPDGECRTFDAAANGSVIGNGVGVVALKRLEDALEDGDVIYAVIRGSAVNNDGILKVGYTAPGMSGQASVITEALANAGVEPDTISYVEAHGTATPLGDAVELAAMHKAFTARTAQTGFCALGSVKPNVGHLDRASGVTGLIKTALALQHQQLPPSLNFAQPNPALDLHDGPFYVNTTLRDWPRGTTPRRAGVSSFGLGGTNAHVVLEEAPERAPSPPAQGSQLLLLSAKTSTALEAMAANLAAYLERQPELNLADVAYTLQVGRSAFNHRRMVVAADMPAAVAALRGSAGPGVATAEQTQRGRPVAFLLPGQADVTALDDLRRTLYASEPAFRAAVEQCCAALRPHLQVDLLPRFAHRNGTTVVAPAEALLFVTEYALTQVLGQWGVRPSALLGAGIGEYVAACLAGVVSLADAAALVAARVAGAALPAVTFQPPRIPYLSQLSGTWITPAEATDPAYWMRLLAQRGDTALDLAALDAAPQQVYVEMGPGTAMSTLVPARLAQTDAHDPAADARTRLLHTLGRLWLAGVDVEWAGLHTGTARRRVALPTYPFERRRYWVEAQRPAERAIKQAAGESTAGGKQAAIDDWFYLPVWKQSLGISEANLPSQTQRQGPWLLLLDESGLGRRIEAQLRAYGCDLIAVRAGAFFTQHDPRSYTINPGQPDDYHDLLRSLDEAPRTIIHLWSLIAPSGAPSTPETFDHAQEYGFFSLLYLARSLAQQAITGDVQICVVSPTTHKVTGSEELHPEHAPMLGAARVIPQEFLNITCRSIDIALPPAGSPVEHRVARRLVAECVAPRSERAVAYRGLDRWVQTYEPARLPQPAPEVPPLRQGGVYLITGGLGEVGLVLAEHLARTAAARLVLVGRTPLPARETWNAELAQRDTTDPLRRKLERVRALEALGAEVLLAVADVADAAAMAAVIRQARERFGGLHGVIHAATATGEQGFGTIQDISRAGCELQFGPKVHGLYVLEQVLADDELDFCVLFSSLAAILGGLGFVAYTAANSFMDAFAHMHNQTHAAHWTSVSWDTWQVRANAHGDLGATIADYTMTPAEGVAAFERVLAAGAAATHLVNSTGDLQTRLDQWVPLVSFQARANPVVLYPRPALTTPYVAPANETEQRVAEVWQTVLGIADIGIHDNFLELGGNSLIGTQVVSRLRQAFALNIPLTILFEAPTIAELALAIELMLLEEIEGLSEEEALTLEQIGG